MRETKFVCCGTSKKCEFRKWGEKLQENLKYIAQKRFRKVKFNKGSIDKHI